MRKRTQIAFVLLGIILSFAIPALATTVLDSGKDVKSNVTFHKSSGPNVTIGETFNFTNSNPWVTDDRIYLEPYGNFTSNGNTELQLDNVNGTWTNVSNLDVSGTALIMEINDKQRVEIEGNTSHFNYTDMNPDDGSIDFRYSGSNGGTTKVTISDLSGSQTYKAVNISDGSKLDKATANSSGVVTFSLPQSEHDVELKSVSSSSDDETVPNSFDLVIEFVTNYDVYNPQLTHMTASYEGDRKAKIEGTDDLTREDGTAFVEDTSSDLDATVATGEVTLSDDVEYRLRFEGRGDMSRAVATRYIKADEDDESIRVILCSPIKGCPDLPDDSTPTVTSTETATVSSGSTVTSPITTTSSTATETPDVPGDIRRPGNRVGDVWIETGFFDFPGKNVCHGIRYYDPAAETKFIKYRWYVDALETQYTVIENFAEPISYYEGCADRINDRGTSPRIPDPGENVTVNATGPDLPEINMTSGFGEPVNASAAGISIPAIGIGGGSGGGGGAGGGSTLILIGGGVGAVGAYWYRDRLIEIAKKARDRAGRFINRIV